MNDGDGARTSMMQNVYEDIRRRKVCRELFSGCLNVQTCVERKGVLKFSSLIYTLGGRNESGLTTKLDLMTT